MINIIFDECISKKLIRKVKEIIDHHPEKAVSIHHLQDYYKQGVRDIEWISKLDKGWLVITSDRGINSPKEDKLPLICKQKGVSCVIMSQGYYKRKQFYKAVAILYFWDEIIDIFSQPAGSQYRLRLTTKLKPHLEL